MATKSTQDHQEDKNPKASSKAGEAKGAKPAVVAAAEKPMHTAKQTNPVAEAAGSESLDPYAAGQHIANPEPNNGADNAPTEKQEKKAVKESVDRNAQTQQDQKVAEKKADVKAEKEAKK